MKVIFKSLLKRLGLTVSRLPKAVPYEPAGDLGLYKTAIGSFYLPVDAPNDIILNRMRSGQVFEPEVVELARRFITPGSTVLDVGSNFGQMAVLFSGMVTQSGKVYAFEAQRRVYDALCRSLQANGIEHVEPVHGAVFDQKGQIFHFPPPDFVRFDAYGSYNIPLDSAVGDEVWSVRIDDMAIEGTISFMKVDVQGCDLFAMRGARATIMKHKMPIVFEFEQRFQAEYGTTFQDYVDFVAEIGYRFDETVMDINYLILPR